MLKLLHIILLIKLKMSDPLNCINVPLAKMAVGAQTVYGPTPLYPFFYSQSECNGDSNRFPRYNDPVTCPSNGSPLLSDNCLRTFLSTATFSPTQTGIIDQYYVNYLPDNPQNVISNIFEESDRLVGIYVPPNFTVYFFSNDPSVTAPSASNYLKVNSGELIVNSCASELYLSDGVTKFIEPGPTFTCTDVNETICNAPFFVCVENKTFHDVILDMCIKSTPYHLVSTSNFLNSVWRPHEFACDNYIKNMCTTVTEETDEHWETCSCFRQQIELDAKYGVDAKVPVCSFGVDLSGDADKSCAFNTQAYKTSEMMSACASIAECTQTSIDNPDGLSKCESHQIRLPKELTETTQEEEDIEIPVDTFISKQTPDYVWYFIMGNVVMLVIFIGILSFVGLPNIRLNTNTNNVPKNKL